MLFLYVLVAVLCMILFYKLLFLYANGLTRNFVELKHRDAEAIMATKYVPICWRDRIRLRVALLFGSSFAQRYAVHRVRSLVKYFGNTPLVDSEPTREKVVDRLTEIASDWQSKSWSEIYPYT